jgi:formate hydrogenlyase transcriptional activator
MNIDSLQRIMLSVARSRGLDAILQTMVRGLAEQSDVALARIWLVAPGDICATCGLRRVCPDQTRCLHLVSSAGNPLSKSGAVEETAENWTRIDGHFRRLPLNTPLKVNHVGGTGQPVLLQLRETPQGELWFARPDWVKAQRIQSFAGHPLIFQEEVLGVLGVFSRARLKQKEFEWLGAFANHAAAAITNIRATEHIKVLNAQITATADRSRTLLEINNAIITHLSEETLLRSIAEALRRVVSFDRAALTLYQHERDVFRFMAIEGDSVSDYFRPGLEIDSKENSFGWVFRHQQSIIRRDLEQEQEYANERRLAAEGMRSHCVVPLIVRGESIGTLSVASGNKDRYSGADAQFLQEVANQVALAIKNMTSYEDISSLNAKVAQNAERWRAVFENSAIGVALTDPSGRFLAANRAYQKMLGYTEEELRALSFLDVTDGDYRASNRTLAVELLEGKREQFQIEKQYRRKDGTLVWGRTNVSVVPGSESMPRFMMGLCEDITERKRSEVALQKSEEHNRILLEINNAIITNLTQEALLQSIAKALRRVISFDRSAITLYSPERRTFRFLAVEGHLLSDYFQTGLEVGHDETSASWAFDHQQTLLRRDLEQEQQFANERRLCAEGIRSLCVAPLIFLGESIGTLSVVSRSKDQYSEANAAFLQEVANQVALAVVNMKSYEEIAALNKTVARTADQLRTLLEINNAIITNLSEEALLRSFSEAVRRVVPFDRAALTLYLPGKNAFRYLAIESRLASDYFRPGLEFEHKESISAWVFDNQRAVVRRDLEKEQHYSNDRHLVAEGLRSDCVVPLMVRGTSIGTLNVGSTTKNQYSEADAEYLREVANQFALAVENTKSYEEIAALKARLEKENIYLQEEIRTGHNFEEIIGSSPALLAVLRKVEQVAPTDSTVLIKGQTGTGKELIARAIHDRSIRRHRPLVRVDCGAFSAGLVESELFGHVRGAFTGAIEKRIGRFELADGGTIFLDEVGELPLETQVKLLRVLQEREFELVGSSHPVRVDVRVIAATNRNLEEDVRMGRFRSDLFYRLNVFPLEIPPLRDRRIDIPPLVMFYLTRFCRRLGKEVKFVGQETMDHLADYPWPGNVRELQNVVERAVVLSQGPILQLDQDLLPVLVSGRGLETAETPTLGAPPVRPAPSGIATLEEVERGHILVALQETNGVIEGPRGAARILNLHPNTLRHRMEKLGIKRSGHRAS